MVCDVDDPGLIGVVEVEVKLEFVEGSEIGVNVTVVIPDDADEVLVVYNLEVDVPDSVTFPVQTDPFVQHPPFPSGVATQYWPLRQHPPPAMQYIRQVMC